MLEGGAPPYTAQHFGRAILMPNLVLPIRTSVQEAPSPIARAAGGAAEALHFTPLMTCYLATDETDPDDVERGFRDGVFTKARSSFIWPTPPPTRRPA